ncbi:hypothetical protein OTU49_006134 [Cherax quadricarinatus]|uniref:Uncharacterized protein n=1 Tax=Cherax quadricarinatus TaxID=27406 RepID=A0AAW0X8G8_CHEQU
MLLRYVEAYTAGQHGDVALRMCSYYSVYCMCIDFIDCSTQCRLGRGMLLSSLTPLPRMQRNTNISDRDPLVAIMDNMLGSSTTCDPRGRRKRRGHNPTLPGPRG